jgi:hypothetical protein
MSKLDLLKIAGLGLAATIGIWAVLGLVYLWAARTFQ